MDSSIGSLNYVWMLIVKIIQALIQLLSLTLMMFCVIQYLIMIIFFKI